MRERERDITWKEEYLGSGREMSYCRKAGVACYDSNQGKMREKLNSTF